MKILSCMFNMDTVCVELKFDDGTMIAIDAIAVENEIADNMYQRSELDYLILSRKVDTFCTRELSLKQPFSATHSNAAA